MLKTLWKMKRYYVWIATPAAQARNDVFFFFLLTLSTLCFATEAETSLSRAQAFMAVQNKQLTTNFPYRINLFTEGQIDKNKAGIRIAELAKQFASDNSGLVFFYQLYNKAMRVPHWHANAVEVGTVLRGKMRVTIWEGANKKHQFIVEKNATWMIPQASLHALENVGSEELTFFVAYNSPIAADRDFATAWAALPDDILAKAVGLTPEDIASIRKTTINRLSSDDAAADLITGDVASPFSSSFDKVAPLYQSSLGSIKRVNAENNTMMQQMSLQQTTLKPGTLRLPHWYTKGDVLLYVEHGEGYFMMMDNQGNTYHAIIKPGDLISIPVGHFHAYLNTKNEDLVVYETFNVAKGIEEITLLEGAQQFAPGTIKSALGLSEKAAEQLMGQAKLAYMVGF